MTKTLFLAFLGFGLLMTSDPAFAGGKRDGTSCHVSRSCRSGVCVRVNPADKFGVCCAPQSCAALGAQCGIIDNGCGVPINCEDCGPGDSCVSNQCVAGTTTTSTTSTTTTSTSTSTTTSTTTTSTSTTTTSTTTSTSLTTTSTTNTTSTTLADAVIDLSVTKQASPTGIFGTNAPVVFTVTVLNSGPDTATGIVVSDILSDAFVFDSSSASQGTYSDITGEWSVGALANGDDATLGINTHANSCGIYSQSSRSNTAEVIAADQGDADSVPDNNNPAEDDQAIASVFFGCD